jgi:hypothetical protein
MLEEAYGDLKELIETEKHNTLKMPDQRQYVVTDFKCLSAIRMAVRNTKRESSIYKKAITIINNLIQQDIHAFSQTPAVGAIDTSAAKLFTKSHAHRTSLGATPSLPSREQPREQLNLQPNVESSLSLTDLRASRYRENIFGREDLHLYRAVLYFYSQNYKQAIADFETSGRLKAETKAELESAEGDCSENASVDTDLSDVGLCASNVNELHFNIVLCYILVLNEAIFLDERLRDCFPTLFDYDGEPASEIHRDGLVAARTVARNAWKPRRGRPRLRKRDQIRSQRPSLPATEPKYHLRIVSAHGPTLHLATSCRRAVLRPSSASTFTSRPSSSRKSSRLSASRSSSRRT